MDIMLLSFCFRIYYKKCEIKCQYLAVENRNKISFMNLCVMHKLKVTEKAAGICFLDLKEKMMQKMVAHF